MGPPLDLNPELGSGPGIAHGKEASHVLFDDGLRHEEPHSGACLGALCGEVGIEGLVYDLFGDTSGVVERLVRPCRAP
jgi:hypothetical protein